MNYKEYFGEWIKVIDENKLYEILKNLKDLYSKGISVCPDSGNIFKAFRLCSLSSCKVIMIGQDPYSQRGVANGLLFGNHENVPEKNLSPSLKVIKEAVMGTNDNLFDNTMEYWASQGILMINSSLTVEENKTGSHYGLWRRFMIKFINSVSVLNIPSIYVLFGNQAQSLEQYIHGGAHIILKEKHPAYFARTGQKMSGEIFRCIEERIKTVYGESIKWYKDTEKM